MHNDKVNSIFTAIAAQFEAERPTTKLWQLIRVDEQQALEVMRERADAVLAAMRGPDHWHSYAVLCDTRDEWGPESLTVMTLHWLDDIVDHIIATRDDGYRATYFTKWGLDDPDVKNVLHAIELSLSDKTLQAVGHIGMLGAEDYPALERAGAVMAVVTTGAEPPWWDVIPAEFGPLPRATDDRQPFPVEPGSNHGPGAIVNLCDVGHHGWWQIQDDRWVPIDPVEPDHPEGKSQQ